MVEDATINNPVTTTKNTRRRPTWRCTVIQLAAAAAPVGPAIASWPHEIVLWTVLSAIPLLALVLRWRWLLPCLVLGFLAGMFVLDPAAKGGTQESQMNETCGNLAIGTILGLAIGIALDSADRWRSA